MNLRSTIAVALAALGALASWPPLGQGSSSRAPALDVRPPASHATGTLVLYEFEQGAEGWEPLDATGAPGSVCASVSLGAMRVLGVGTKLPGVGGARVVLPEGKRNWHPFTHLQLSVYTPAAAPSNAQVIVYLKDADLNYYQHLRRSSLRPGAWTHLRLDLTADSTDWEFRGHYKPWDGYCRHDVQELGVKFVCAEPYEGPFYLDGIRLARDPSALPAANAIYNLRANAAVVGRYEKFELSFNLARTYSNPFDPDEVDVRGRFILPDRTVVTVPGFFYQGYLRRMDKGAERLVPMGHSQWKIRFAPREPGTYHYYVVVKDTELIRSDMGQFRCVESNNRGFVRISEDDPSYLEFDDGSFFYPIGHNIASVFDARARTLQVNIPASEGTYAYDRILSRMAEAGENFGRIWMSPWSFGLEWTKAYDVHYKGLGRYNLRNAWRLDHVLRTAEQKGIRALLLFAAHGELGDYESDFLGHDRAHCQGSPYWSGRGGRAVDRNYRGPDPHPGYHGPIDHPKQIYTSEEVLKLFKRKVRYIVGRWGYSTAVMAWEILNEPDLASFYKGNERHEGVTYGELGARFVQALARHIRELDPAEHLITSGCFWYRNSFAHPTHMVEEIDFTTGHVFDENIEHRLLADLRYMRQTFQKIFLATEAGLTPFAQDAETTALAMHRTLWASFMMPGAGAAAPWWWVLIDRRDLYHYFRALVAFAQGEDRRGMGYDAGRGSAQDESGQRKLNIVVLTNGKRAFCWIYHPTSFTSRALWEVDPVAPATVTINGLEPGAYDIEIWDTYRGEIVDRQQGQSRPADGDAADTVLVLKTPPFARDIACKVRPK